MFNLWFSFPVWNMGGGGGGGGGKREWQNHIVFSSDALIDLNYEPKLCFQEIDQFVHFSTQSRTLWLWTALFVDILIAQHLQGDLLPLVLLTATLVCGIDYPGCNLTEFQHSFALIQRCKLSESNWTFMGFRITFSISFSNFFEYFMVPKFRDTEFWFPTHIVNRSEQ